MGEKKGLKFDVDLKQTNEILTMASEVGAEFIQIEGVLNDTYLIYNHDTETGRVVLFGDLEQYKYIILDHEFASSWHNNLFMLLTDDDKEAEKYEKMYEEYMQEIEEED